MQSRCYIRIVTLFVYTLWPAVLIAADKATPLDELLEMDLARLMDVEVNLVSRTPQRQFDTPAAVYVISREQIQRSGLKTIPDLLRLAPGVQVGKIDGSTWSIDIRNNPSRFSRNLQVLMDGRTLYNPLFGGVNWDVQDTFLPDIERIEVIRGPGGTLWGTNAVDGIINIVTRRSEDTIGTRLQGLVGRGDVAYDGGGRYGTRLSENLSARAYVKTRELDNGEFLDSSQSNNTLFPAGDIAHDDANLTQAGFRSDWHKQSATLSLQGDYYDGETRDVNSTITSNPGNSDTDVSGGNLLARWTQRYRHNSELKLQAYYDYTRRSDETFREKHNIFDLDIQHSFSVPRQRLTWGVGYRHLQDKTQNKPPGTFALRPENRNDNLYTSFAQDQINILPNKLQLTVGGKFEHNDYSGYEYQSSGRLLWTLNTRHNIWAAITRAVRTPTRADEDAILDFGDFIIPISDENSKAQPMLSREIGYRGQWAHWLAVDVATYWNRYSHTGSTSTREIWGFEVNPHLAFGENLSVETWYAYSRGRRNTPAGQKTNQELVPNHTAGLSSYWQPQTNWQTDITILYVDSTGRTNVDIDSQTRLDLHVGWAANRHWRLDGGLNNLLDAKHAESFDSTKVNTGVRRGGYLQIGYNFE